MTSYRINEEHKGIEITFSEKPSEEVRKSLKDAGFHWHTTKKIWYAKETQDRLKMAQELISGKVPEDKPSHSLKVGDVLVSSWGYDQTNLTFYQVIRLKGKTMVELSECYLKEKYSEGVSGMSRNVSFLIPGEDGAVVTHSGKKPFARKVKNYSQGMPEGDFVEINSYANAHKYYGAKLYESWYA